MAHDEATTVKVDAWMENGIVVLSPCDKDGQELMQQVLDGEAETSLWHFQGTKYSEPHTKDRIIGVHYACGGTRCNRSKGNVSWTDYDGAIKIHFDLQEVTHVDALYALRDIGYYIGGLLVQSDSTSEQMRLSPAKNCKVCDGLLRKRVELEWRTCDACSVVCEHQYDWGVGQARGQIAYLHFCTTCGRADPGWEPSEDPMEDTIKAVSEGGLDMLFIQHPDQTTTVISKK